VRAAGDQVATVVRTAVAVVALGMVGAGAGVGVGACGPWSLEDMPDIFATEADYITARDAVATSTERTRIDIAGGGVTEICPAVALAGVSGPACAGIAVAAGADDAEIRLAGDINSLKYAAGTGAT